MHSDIFREFNENTRSWRVDIIMVQIDGLCELRATKRLLIKSNFQLCGRSISPEYRRANYRKKCTRWGWLMQRKLTRVRVISSECRSNGRRWNVAIFTSVGRAAPWPGHTFWHNRQLDVHVSVALRRADSVTSTDIRWRTGEKGRRWNSFR